MEWKPIETAPAVGKKRLLFWGLCGKQLIGYRHAKTKLIKCDDGHSYVASHWMELPGKPE